QERPVEAVARAVHQDPGGTLEDAAVSAETSLVAHPFEQRSYHVGRLTRSYLVDDGSEVEAVGRQLVQRFPDGLEQDGGSRGLLRRAGAGEGREKRYQREQAECGVRGPHAKGTWARACVWRWLDDGYWHALWFSLSR